MIKTNRDLLVMQSVIGAISSPAKSSPYRISHNGIPMILPGTGGITYNFAIGDNCMNLIGDHVEPGVSMKQIGKDKQYYNGGLNISACIGNIAKIVSGEAKGKTGYVTGKHGGIEHILVWFDENILEDLVIGDRIQIKSFGLGLAIEDHPEITITNLAPDLLNKINPEFDDEGYLMVPVTHIIGPEIMGSGIGASTVARGDYDITTADPITVKKYNLETLRFGDIIAITDTDNTFGRTFRTGAISIGVVVHSNCVIAGHGPGFTTIFTSATGKIKPVMKSYANIAHYLGVKDLS